MPKINVLPKSVAELIAAGEVVERPSSAVKELIENSIDAGASSVTVEIKNGGVKYIRVTDDGCGIHREDVKTAFISHATSKISSGEDLDAIFTLGFRGEALPSIAAVSRLSMLTKTKDEKTGTVYEIEGGEEIAFDDAGCPDGTTVMIRDLFYNTPARMKFLKKDMTEGSYVSDVVAKAAISHPDIRFNLIKDGKQTLSTPGNGDLKSTVYSVFGKEVSEGLIPCEYEYKSIKINGLISRPLNNRPNRNLQYCFVNGRYVRMPVAAAALDEAYKNRIMVGKFPMCFLFINIPAGKIDVNVHPAKTEIRFSEDSQVFESVFYAARSALNKGDDLRPEVSLRDKKDITAKKEPEVKQMSFSASVNKVSSALPHIDTRPVFSGIKDGVKEKNVNEEQKAFSDIKNPVAAPAGEKKAYDAFIDNKKPFSVSVKNDISEKANSLYSESKAHSEGNEVFRDTSGMFMNMLSREEVNRRNIELTEKAVLQSNKPVFTVKEETAVSTEKAEPAYGSNNCNEKEEKNASFRIVGEVFRTYILVESEGKLLIIDKHAAHERMIFNRLSEKGFSEDSQMLLTPVSVSLTGKEYAVVLDNLNVFNDGGFCVEDFGGSTVIVRECPVILRREDIASVITEMAGELLRGNMKPVPEKITWLYHSTACRAAIKAGDDMKDEEMDFFVSKLLSDDDIRYCPHGRPVMYELTKHEIEKQFGRV